MDSNLREKIYEICFNTRKNILKKYSDVQGKCIEASEMIQEELNKLMVSSKLIEGWCLYDDDSNCTDRCYDEHTWLELEDGTYIDVTADQFEYCIYDDIPEIIIGEKPYYMLYDKPKFTWLDEKE